MNQLCLFYTFSVCIKQINRFGFEFDYKTAHRHAWLYGAGIILTVSILLAVTFADAMKNYMHSDSPFDMFIFAVSSLYHNQSLTAPSLTYIHLMQSLQKRYAALNQLLRYFFFEFRNGSSTEMCAVLFVLPAENVCQLEMNCIS